MKYHKSFENFVMNSKHLAKMEEFISTCSDLCPKRENVFRFLNCDLNDNICKVYDRNFKVSVI